MEKAKIMLLSLVLLAACSSKPATENAPGAEEAGAQTVHVRILVLKPARGRVQLSATAQPRALEEERFDPEGDCVVIVRDAAGKKLAERKLGYGSEIADHRRGKMKLIDVSIEAPDSADNVELFEQGKRTAKAAVRWKEEPPPSAI